MSNRVRQMGLMAASLVVAYLLVLNVVLGGLAMGTHAGMGVALGPSGEVICLAAPTQDGPGDKAGHLLDCCTAGCRVGMLASLPPPDLSALPAPLVLPALALVAAPADDAPAGTGRLPHNARAPPLA
ncbi:hypothetical protein LGR54_12785 [Ancylobacter sp. Lp-2]|uniref:hypothetical protein n=1 Tax=Ancylobacter sp. Lp-2 TaxID=2881339 RepID=UPI001E50E082|nr:hypothetical protein [Ancylobacter sp. Lp-2]MCB4769486.1 hypothetical protein [Ancylobacter sp. Lp-2]